MRVGYVKFYPKDVEKLERLREVSLDEYHHYKSFLVKSGRCISPFDEKGQQKWRKVLSDSGIALSTTIVDGVTWTYTVKDGVASIGDGFGVAIPPSTSGAITIPSKLGGYPVTRIGDSAFSGCKGFTDVKIPDSVTGIGTDAFAGCEGLANMTIPPNVTRIGDKAFSWCSRLASVTIPDGVTHIGREAFSRCYALASVTIPGSLRELEDGVFSECRALSNVNIAEGVTNIGFLAFEKCSSLRSVTIPASVKNIDRGTFSECDELMQFVVSEGNAVYSSANGLLLSKDGTTLIMGVNGDVIIPDGVTTIGCAAFHRRGGLTSVAMPASMSVIETNAFLDCLRLKSVTMLGDVANIRIGEKAFGGCYLNKVDAPASKKSDGETLLSCISNHVVKSAWEGNVKKLSQECIRLMKEKSPDDKDRRENISRLLQAAFAIMPKEWNISNACEAGLYFLSFCKCLGLSPTDKSDRYNSPLVALLMGYRTAIEISTDDDVLMFEFTYGKSANDALRNCESRSFPTCFEGAKDRLLFGVNYNPEAHNIDKPLTTSFYSSHVPNFAISPMNGDDEVFGWRRSSRDEYGRGDDVVPTDANDVALWLRQRRDRKEQLQKDERQKIQREREECKIEEQQRRWQVQDVHRIVQPHGSPCRTDFDHWQSNKYDKRYEALLAAVMAIAIGVLIVLLYRCFFVR